MQLPPLPLLFAALFATTLGFSAFACGSATVAAEGPGGNTTPGEGATASERSCLDLANAQRERRASEPDQVHVKHLLVKHRDSRNPREGVTRSREEACARALQLRDRVLGGADFDELVSEASDEPGAATRSGDLGSVKRSDLVPAFADAAFLLDLQQMSDVVETPFGFHLIVRVP